MSDASDRPPFVVRAPFDDPCSADIVLRSCDGIDFHVFKGVLIVASPVFRDMIATSSHLPVCPASVVGEDFTKDGLPVVAMHESSAPVLDTLLRLLHPITPPMLGDLDIISRVAFAAIKYDMGRAIELIREALLKSSRSVSGATHAYMVAMAHGWTGIARECALETLKYPIEESDFAPKIGGGMSLVHMWKLLSYRKAIEAGILLSVIPERLPTDELNTVNQCSSNCSGDKRSTGSWVWLKWRSTMMAKVHEAPLAENVADVVELKEIAARTSCPTCSKKVPPKAQRIVEMVRERRLAYATSFEFDFSLS